MHRRIIYILIILLTAFNANAQKGKGKAKNQGRELTAEEIQAYKEQCKYLVDFLEGTLNFLGDPNQVMSEKEIIINESYLKIFRDKNVQIEDDLDPNRQVPLRKDVQAYLKDIVFFFKQVEFDFDIKNIEVFTTQNQEPGFKITFNRHLKGVMVSNDTIDNNLTRYMEVNLDPYEKDMKIVSIYTTIPNQKEERRYWWATLPPAWKNFFGVKVLVYDTLPMNQIASFGDSTVVIMHRHDTIVMDTLRLNNDSVASIDTLFLPVYTYDTVKASTQALDFYLNTIFHLKKLDISNNKTIKTLEPVSRLTHLEFLNCSNTSITDLTPLRNLSNLKELDFSKNEVSTITPLHFCFALEEINMANTLVDTIQTLSNLTSIEKLILDHTSIKDIRPLSALNHLKYLSMAYTPVTDLEPIAHLPALTQLILKGSAVKDLGPLASLPALEYINIDDTEVADLTPLAKIPTLTTIQANNTLIKNLDGLGTNQHITLIYCDNTGIDRLTAFEFMEKNPQSLVIFDSQRLQNWWNKLPAAWKKIFTEEYHLTDSITKEQLHQIVNTKEISIAGNKEIRSLEPLRMLFRLEKLDISFTNISSLSALSGLNNLRYLNIEQTPVSSLESLSDLTTLRKVTANNTLIADILPLKNNQSLKTVYCDDTKVTKENVLEFKKYVPGCLVVFQTEHLNTWWYTLDEEWRMELAKQIEIVDKPTKEQLQEIVDLKEVKIQNNPKIITLEPLTEFNYLEKLTVNFTSVFDVTPLSYLDSLKVLNLSNNPIIDITPLAKLHHLEVLYLENTGIEDITPLENLKKLRVLNIAGTKVRKLKPISHLYNLEKLIVNNTGINKLKDIQNLPNLKLIKCYNTNLKKKKVDAFKASHPNVEIVFY